MNLSKREILDILDGYKRTFLWDNSDIESIACDFSEMLFLVHDFLMAIAKKDANNPYGREYQTAIDLMIWSGEVEDVLCDSDYDEFPEDDDVATEMGWVDYQDR